MSLTEQNKTLTYEYYFNTYDIILYSKFSLKSLKKVWRWRVVATNGKIIGASSESYINKQDCIDNAKNLGHHLVLGSIKEE